MNWNDDTETRPIWPPALVIIAVLAILVALVMSGVIR